MLVPFSKITLSLKKEVALEIPYESIHKVEVREDMLNYRIELDTDDGLIALSAQQKELSEFRSSGTLAAGISGLNTSATAAGFLNAGRAEKVIKRKERDGLWQSEGL